MSCAKGKLSLCYNHSSGKAISSGEAISSSDTCNLRGAELS